jgi:dienelactone hydrolase
MPEDSLKQGDALMTTTAAPIARRESGIVQLVRTATHETTLAVCGLLVVAVHVVDDSFVQPQPGTSAGDHLVSGLVPVAVLLGVAAIYPRVRPGLRASLAAPLGLFGVVAGIEAIYYANAGRLSGDDYTGFAAMFGGLLLLSVAARTLWRTRRLDDNVVWRYVRRVLLAAVSVVVTYLVVGAFLLSYVLTHTARAFVPVDRLGATHEEVTFKTADGLRLRGWYVPSKNGAAVISFPGRKGSQRPARLLAAHGFGVLVFDRRGEGESEGDPNAWGWAGYRDVDAAVAFLQRRTDVEPGRIGGIGLSVGGEMMLEAAAKSRGLKAVVSEGAGERSVRELLDMTGRDKWLALPQYAALSAGVSLFSNHTPPSSLKDLVGRIAPTPVFFIYGEHGQDGERNLNPQYFAAAHAPKQIWEVPDSGHVGGITAHPQDYERRVTEFFDRALLSEASQ